MTNETVNLAIPRPTDALIVGSLKGGQGVRVASYARTRAAYHSTACGRILLAFKSKMERQAIHALAPLAAATPRTITDPEQIERVLATCRRDGFAAEYGENEIGAHCMAAPVFGPGGDVIPAVSVAGPAGRMRDAEIARIGAATQKPPVRFDQRDVAADALDDDFWMAPPRQR